MKLNQALASFFATNAANALSIEHMIAAAKAEKIKTAEAFKPIAMEAASKHYKVGIVVLENGKEKWDTDAKNYEACKKACNRAIAKVFPGAKGDNNTDPVAGIVTKIGKLNGHQKRRLITQLKAEGLI
jgi:hypothetical protein